MGRFFSGLDTVIQQDALTPIQVAAHVKEQMAGYFMESTPNIIGGSLFQLQGMHGSSVHGNGSLEVFGFGGVRQISDFGGDPTSPLNDPNCRYYLQCE